MRKFFALLLSVLYFVSAQCGEPVQGDKIHKDCLGSCHKVHGAKGGGPLIKEETLNDVCLRCHNAKDPTIYGGKAVQLRPPGGNLSSHIMNREEKGKFNYMKRFTINEKRLVLTDSCAGCHDPHMTNGEELKTYAFDERGNATSTRRRYVGELCYGCHAGIEAVSVERSSDIGILTGSSAKSRHRMGSTADSRKDLPSLKRILDQKPLDCISCHNNPSDGAKGPHFSPYPSLLVASFGRELYGAASEDDANALCFRCHDKDSIEADQSFPLHREHVTGLFNLKPGISKDIVIDRQESVPALPSKRPGFPKEQMFQGFGQPTPCATCHDPHGSLDNPSLINFDRDVASNSSFGKIEYRKTGSGAATVL
jgi:predicted CXXCH cytochrome family protein